MAEEPSEMMVMAGRRAKRRKELESRCSPPLAGIITDMDATLRRELAGCVARANTQAAELESIGADVFAALGSLSFNTCAAELAQGAHRMRGLALHALLVAGQLHEESGRLTALAALHESAGPSGATCRRDDDGPGGRMRG